MAIKTYTAWESPNVSDWNTYATNGGLEWISEYSIAGVTTNISNMFSSTYRNYRLVFSNLYNTTTAAAYMLFSFTAGAGTNHYCGLKAVDNTAAVTLNFQNGSAYWLAGLTGGTVSNVSSTLVVDIFNPQNAFETTFVAQGDWNAGGQYAGGIVNTNTQYTDLQIVGLFGATLIGTLRWYGYRDT